MVEPPPPVVPAKPKVQRPKPRPVETRVDPRPAPPEAAPVASAAPSSAAPSSPAPAAAAAAPNAPVVSANALAQWQGRLLAHLERHKRYPSRAQSRRQEGVVSVRFVLDRQGSVLSARLENSSGYEALDQEGLALPERAQPLPSPPPGVGGERIELVVPIRFFLR
ncbi:energy transducer TonB family protein [Pararhodospirillum photometricum]|uniref:Protein TonB n=1 Tax=Pararhodospirillum photometricum DSM 122 TaxID=1150469 RepID=H6SQZ4_PARPM|nr:energy transducer TonB [Pararhodospirillum photometricum]CCG09716.1 Protein TonB [Pararhodospirillum photometricum DSM 122]